MEEVKIKLVGPIFDLSSLSQWVREFAMACFDNGIAVSLQDVTGFPLKAALSNEKINKLNIMQSQKFDKNFVTIHCYPPELFRQIGIDKNAKANIFWCVYPTDRIPYVWKLILSNDGINQVWVGSDFNRDSFIKSKLDAAKIRVVNLGVDTKLYNNQDPKIADISKNGEFNFAYISDLKISRGYDVMLKAFFEEFSDEPKAKLLFKCASSSDQNMLNGIINMIKSYKGNSKAEVLMLHGNKSEEYMASLYRSVDCLVSPTRGEGWGFNLIQSLSSGVPVITTECSSHMTYCNSTNAILIDANYEKIHHIDWLLATPAENEHWWWEPNFTQLKKKMRYAFDNRKALAAKSETLRQSVEKYDWSNSVMQAVQNISEIK